MSIKTVGVIGLGSIGAVHAKNLKSLGCDVIVHDPKLPETRDSEYVLGNSDALVISSPSNDHAFQILVAPAGKPLFVEKPIGVSGSDVIEIEAVLRHKKNPIMVGFNLRFHSCVKKAKEWMDAGLIGKPLWANFTCAQFNDKPAYMRDGVILNWSHEIDLALYLLGSGSVSCSSTRLSNGRDDLTDILLTHKNGCRTHIHLDYLTKDELRGFTIVGTTGSININLLNGGVGCLNRDSGGSIGDSLYTPNNSWNENYIDEMKAWLDCIDGKETIGATGEEGMETLRICLEVRKQAGLE